MTDAHAECFKVLRSLRFDWIQDPIVVLDEKLQTVGLTADYLKTEQELFKVFHNKLYRKMERTYRLILDFLVPDHFRWQTSTMWTLLKLSPIDENTYDQIQIAILPY